MAAVHESAQQRALLSPVVGTVAADCRVSTGVHPAWQPSVCSQPPNPVCLGPCHRLRERLVADHAHLRGTFLLSIFTVSARVTSYTDTSTPKAGWSDPAAALRELVQPEPTFPPSMLGSRRPSRNVSERTVPERPPGRKAGAERLIMQHRRPPSSQALAHPRAARSRGHPRAEPPPAPPPCAPRLRPRPSAARLVTAARYERPPLARGGPGAESVSARRGLHNRGRVGGRKGPGEPYVTRGSGEVGSRPIPSARSPGRGRSGREDARA